MLVYIYAICLTFSPVQSIQPKDTAAKVEQYSQQYIQQVNKKVSRTTKQLERANARAIAELEQYENALNKRLSKIDSMAAKRVFDPLNKFKPGAGKGGGKYDSYVDTVSSVLGMLGKDGNIGKYKDQLTKAVGNVDELQSKFEEVQQVRQFIAQRKQYLQSQLGQYTDLKKYLSKYNQAAYSYVQQVQEYKDILQDRKKIEKKVVELVKNSKQFKELIQQNSLIASLFNFQNTGGTASLEGLQTRSQVEQLIQQRLGGAMPGAGGGGGSNDATAALRDQMSSARERMETLRNQFPGLDNAAEMPNFKPNEMKQKRFLQRLEYGTNMQFQKNNQYFPASGDVGLQVGYKFSKNGTIGVGGVYKLGLGSGWNNIQFTSAGAGLRSYMDYKLKGTFFVNGGFERTYNFNSPEKVQSAFNSALLGVSKKYKINNKLKGNIIILYDFLHNQHYPATQPVQFRVGYNM
ncbi:hypothetical protein LX64_01840 [Chitinophaga skermanii]|uniref:Uncharacterized protein n=1 Tax=Chitinophaga skermanii TaxID=331697 RepID=A0A327QTH8_9BACT|nr:hypothetical protein [Chitinophaga skermanii]RAJ06713.1 hypothetical protein LX64_01840 [Chitinophaga skermanii]